MKLEYPIFQKEQQQPYKRYWDHSQLLEQEFRETLSRHPSFRNCFDPKLNLTKSFKDDIKRRTRGDIPLSIVIQIFGKQGDGKSKLGFKTAKWIDPKFNHKKVFMKVESLLNYCKYAKPNDCLILDEQALEFGEGSLRQSAELQNIEEITRIKQLHFIYCSPTLREHLSCHYTLKVIQKNIKRRITKFAFCNQRGTYFYGWGLAKIPKDSEDPIWQKYEPIKLEYVERVLQRDSKKYDIWEKVDNLIKHPSHKFVKSKGDLVVLCRDLWPTLTTGEHKTIINAYHLFLREFQHDQAKKQEKG